MMEFFEAKCPWHIQIGSLFIAPGRVPNTGTVWLGEINGRQGSEIKTDELAEVLLEFYNRTINAREN
jgi:hypothetical protein